MNKHKWHKTTDACKELNMAKLVAEIIAAMVQNGRNNNIIIVTSNDNESRNFIVKEIKNNLGYSKEVDLTTKVQGDYKVTLITTTSASKHSPNLIDHKRLHPDALVISNPLYI